MGMVAVIYKKGAPDNFVWEETKVGSPECGQVRLRSTAVGVNFADTYHRAGIPHPMIVGDPPVVVGFEGVGQDRGVGSWRHRVLRRRTSLHLPSPARRL
jgi:NADPH2:quinone reductase